MYENKTFKGYEVNVKYFAEPSDWGIEYGRISKLDIRKDGKIYARYDRGWDIIPEPASEAETVLLHMMALYN